MFNFKKSAVCLLSSGMLFLNGCATIMNGPNQMISVSTTPTDANIWVDQYYVGKSPVILQLERKYNHVIHIELEGFQPYDIVLTKKISKWTFANIIIPGSIIAVAVDAMTGAIYYLTPEQVGVVLEQETCVYSKNGEVSHVMVVLKADPSWEKIGQLIVSR